jgi:hypothetical protein
VTRLTRDSDFERGAQRHAARRRNKEFADETAIFV